MTAVIALATTLPALAQESGAPATIAVGGGLVTLLLVAAALIVAVTISRARALPGFDEIDRQIRATMASTTVYKVKLYDLRGVTVYSSEPEQVGEDRSGNAGWLSARHGVAASELTHRDRLSAFEGVVENRDVIQTYVPLHRPGSSTVVAVFEIYSDATPFVDALGEAGARLARTAEGNLAAFQRMAGQSYSEVRASSRNFLVIVYGMLLLLYVALLAIVRDGQRVIDRQAKAQGEAMRREESRHRDKMAALATMANNVSHQIGNPLAIITGIAEDLAGRLRPADPAAAEQASRVIDETTRIAGMTREIADLAASGSDAWEWIDVNAKVSAACRFLSFDHRLAGSPLDFRPGSGLPACAAIPGALTEVLMDLLQICGERQARDGGLAPIVVETFARGGAPVVRIGTGAFASVGARSGDTARTFDAMRRRCATFRARLAATEGAVELVLAPAMPAEGGTTDPASSAATSGRPAAA
jgi:signal transduction histidine kinase